MIPAAKLYLLELLTYSQKCVFDTFGDLDLNLENINAKFVHLTSLAVGKTKMIHLFATTGKA